MAKNSLSSASPWFPRPRSPTCPKRRAPDTAWLIAAVLAFGTRRQCEPRPSLWGFPFASTNQETTTRPASHRRRDGRPLLIRFLEGTGREPFQFPSERLDFL